MSGPLATFLAFLKEGRFMLQRRTDTGAFVFYPRHVVGTGCEWVEASGRGTVHSATIIRQKPERGGDYAVALVELAEGPRLMCRVVGTDPAEVRIGREVEMVVGAASWKWDGEGPVISCRLATGGEAA